LQKGAIRRVLKPLDANTFILNQMEVELTPALEC
jgi:hypothetical protein